MKGLVLLILLMINVTCFAQNLPKINEVYQMVKVKTVVIKWGRTGLVDWNQKQKLANVPNMRTEIFFEDCLKANNLQDSTLCVNFYIKSDTSLVFAGRIFHFKAKNKFYLFDDGFQKPEFDSTFRMSGLLDGAPLRFKGILDSNFANDLLVLGVIRDSKYIGMVFLFTRKIQSD